MVQCETWLFFALVLSAVSGCDRMDGRAPRQPQSIGVPETLAHAEVIRGQTICPLESINGKPARSSHTFQTGSEATLVGWSTVADKRNPVPSLVYVLFRSIVPDGSAELFWPGIRVARLELSMDARRRDAGFSANGTLAVRPGSYRVIVWVGNTHLMHECDTGQVLDIGE